MKKIIYNSRTKTFSKNKEDIKREAEKLLKEDESHLRMSKDEWFVGNKKYDPKNPEWDKLYKKQVDELKQQIANRRLFIKLLNDFNYGDEVEGVSHFANHLKVTGTISGFDAYHSNIEIKLDDKNKGTGSFTHAYINDLTTLKHLKFRG